MKKAVEDELKNDPFFKAIRLSYVASAKDKYYSKSTSKSVLKYIPENSVEVDTFASGGSLQDEKFAGRKTIGDCTLEKGMFADNSDMAAWNWLTSVVNTSTGDQGLPANYRRTVVISHVDRLGRVTQKWTLLEVPE